MPCFGCYQEKQLQSRRRVRSQYSIVQQQMPDFDIGGEDRQRNALCLRLQLQVLVELNAQTYGLEVDGKTSQYEAKDFFVFKEILGTGPMSVVFRAYFKPTGEAFAVKFIPNFKQCKNMVLRELAILQISDKCRYLTDYHSHFRVGENLYFVIELCEGGSLDDLLGNRHLVPHRIAHLRVSDFNLCRTIEEPNGERLTQCGKAAFRAPEMYLDKYCTLALDWWAVGIMLYRFISGYYPFRTAKLTQGYQSVTKLKEKYPDWMFLDPDATNLCQRFLQKNPKHRLGYTNEVTEIKTHPYFFGVNWDEEENMEHIIDLDVQDKHADSNMPVVRSLYRILGLQDKLAKANQTDKGPDGYLAGTGYWYVKSLLTSGLQQSTRMLSDGGEAKAPSAATETPI